MKQKRPLTYHQVKTQVMANIASSFWLRGAIESLEQRDPLDAVLDVAYLSKLVDLRLKETRQRELRRQA